MTQKQWVQDDYTNSTSYDLEGLFFTDPEMTTAYDASSGHTAEFRLIDPVNGHVLWSTTQNITLDSTGFQVTFAAGASPVVSGSTRVRIILTSSGQRLTAVGVNGSDELYIEFD